MTDFQDLLKQYRTMSETWVQFDVSAKECEIKRHEWLAQRIIALIGEGVAKTAAEKQARSEEQHFELQRQTVEMQKHAERARFDARAIWAEMMHATAALEFQARRP